MARVCQITGKKANNAKHCRHRHSAWKFRAPKKNRTQEPNLQVVRVKTEHGTVKLKVSTRAMRSPEFQAVVAGVKPMPKSWASKVSY